MNETIQIPVKASLIITLGDRTIDVLGGAEVAIPTRPRFERSADGVVTGHDTGLMWSAETIGKEPVKWDQANKLVAELWIGGFKDWRLPTIKELLSIVDYERHDPAIDTEVFECVSGYYWTASPWAPSPAGYAWIVRFLNGHSRGLNRNYYARVRAVRSVAGAGQ